MKRKVKLVIAATLLVTVLAGCGSKDPKETAVSSSTNASTSESSSQEPVVEATKDVVLTGTLLSDAVLTEYGASLHLTEVVGVEDESGVAAGFGEEGVVLNAELEKLAKDFDAADYLTGTKVKVTLVPNPVTTRSLPPQIPGASIISIEKLSE